MLKHPMPLYCLSATIRHDSLPEHGMFQFLVYVDMTPVREPKQKGNFHSLRNKTEMTWLPDPCFRILATRSWLPDATMMLATRFWPPNPGYQILATRFWLRNPGYQILATRFWPPDSGYQILATRSWLPPRSWLSDPGLPDLGYWILAASFSPPG